MPAAPGARKRMIVDAQVHLWKANSPEWPWVPGVKPQLPEPFTIERLVPLMDEAGVDRAVIVPPTLRATASITARSGEALSRSLRRHGPHPDRQSAIGRAAADMEEQPGHARRPASLPRPGAAWLTDGTADWFWPAAEKAALAGHVPHPRPDARHSPASRNAIRSSR